MVDDVSAIPLSLYIHVPWCVQKCPYCDFNSHTLKGGIPEKEYVAHLLDDLRADAHLAQGRSIRTIFIGGGTPSLLSPEALTILLNGVKQIIPVTLDAEITLEANPGTVEAGKFAGFVAGGVNRLSIGVQSFHPRQLKALGRIHDEQQAHHAIAQAHDAGLHSFNIDIMHGLPEQTVVHGLDDLRQAIHHQSKHISWYQLTIEPNTSFHSKPPQLPDDDTLWDIQEQGEVLLAEAGFEQYEISGYAQSGFQCQHNLNYWRFGDYLGIGCGAHSKITTSHGIQRTEKIKHPKGYMNIGQSYVFKQWLVDKDDYPFEFFMNRLRLVEACGVDEYEMLTGMKLPASTISLMAQAQDKGTMIITAKDWQVTALGRRYLNTLLEQLIA